MKLALFALGAFGGIVALLWWTQRQMPTFTQALERQTDTFGRARSSRYCAGRVGAISASAPDSAPVRVCCGLEASELHGDRRVAWAAKIEDGVLKAWEEQ